MVESRYDLLAAVCFDAYLLARYGGTRGALPNGRCWEQALTDLLVRPGLTRRQGPGSSTFFGKLCLSRSRHELDGVAAGWRGHLLVEAKAQKSGVTKADVAAFDFKTFDFYCGGLPGAGSETWWRLIISAGAVTSVTRALCLTQGIVLCEPDRLPLPFLLRAAGRPGARRHLRETLLREVIRLGERTVVTMQERWGLAADGSLRFQPMRGIASELNNLLSLQDELSADLIDLYDRFHPGLIERRASALCSPLQRLQEQAGIEGVTRSLCTPFGPRTTPNLGA